MIMSSKKLALFRFVKRRFLLVVFFSWVLVLLAYSHASKKVLSQLESQKNSNMKKESNMKSNGVPIEITSQNKEEITRRMARDAEMIRKICSTNTTVSKTSATFLKKHPRVAVDHYFMDIDRNMGYCINAKV